MGNTRTIRISGEGGQFTLPVNPKDLSVTQESSHKTVDILNLGTVAVAGNRGLIKASVSTFLPAVNSPFYKGVSPQVILQLMQKWKNGKKPIRIIVSGTNINTTFLIEKISDTYVEGQKDIKVDWGFVEYRILNVATVAFKANLAAGGTGTGLCDRNGGISIPKSVTVKKGDTLWEYAVKYYGDGTKWSRIAEANGISNPKTLQIGMVVSIPN